MGVLSEISNADVHWSGSYFGFIPTLADHRTQSILDQGEAVVPELINALTDESVFVVAHVLLTKISRVEHSAFPTWNGLEIELATDGTVNIKPEQRFELADRWRRWYRMQPRPATLPPKQ